VYNYYRDYDQGTGRYIESDRIGLRSGTNGYAYANSDPTNGYDPLGLLSPNRDWGARQSVVTTGESSPKPRLTFAGCYSRKTGSFKKPGNWRLPSANLIVHQVG
jgi:uncharacterized protein RhaS with RHS repeats